MPAPEPEITEEIEVASEPDTIEPEPEMEETETKPVANDIGVGGVTHTHQCE